MSMIERMARAMCCGPDGCQVLNPVMCFSNEFEPEARACLAVLAEPTPEMIEAGAFEMPYAASDPAGSRDDARKCFTAMIQSIEGEG